MLKKRALGAVPTEIILNLTSYVSRVMGHLYGYIASNPDLLELRNRINLKYKSNKEPFRVHAYGCVLASAFAYSSPYATVGSVINHFLNTAKNFFNLIREAGFPSLRWILFFIKLLQITFIALDLLYQFAVLIFKVLMDVIDPLLTALRDLKTCW